MGGGGEGNGRGRGRECVREAVSDASFENSASLPSLAPTPLPHAEKLDCLAIWVAPVIIAGEKTALNKLSSISLPDDLPLPSLPEPFYR